MIEFGIALINDVIIVPQGVSEVFHKVLAQMEKESGKQPDGGKTCVIS